MGGRVESAHSSFAGEGGCKGARADSTCLSSILAEDVGDVLDSSFASSEEGAGAGVVGSPFRLVGGSGGAEFVRSSFAGEDGREGRDVFCFSFGPTMRISEKEGAAGVRSSAAGVRSSLLYGYPEFSVVLGSGLAGEEKERFAALVYTSPNTLNATARKFPS